jgi:hypothetical protein
MSKISSKGINCPREMYRIHFPPSKGFIRCPGGTLATRARGGVESKIKEIVGRREELIEPWYIDFS